MKKHSNSELCPICNIVAIKLPLSISSFLSKIPGLKLPKKQQAIDTLKKFISEKGPDAQSTIDKIVNTISKSINNKSASIEVTAGFMDTLKSLKGLANPQVIFAIIALMGAMNTTNAETLIDELKNETVDKKMDPDMVSVLKIISPDFVEGGRYIPPSDFLMQAYKYGKSIGMKIETQLDLKMAQNALNKSLEKPVAWDEKGNRIF